MAPSGLRRGFRVGSPPETFDHSLIEYNGRLLRATNHEPRPFGLRCGVPPRQIQTNNDASGSPQRVAGRPLGQPLRNRSQAMEITRSQITKKYTAHGLVRRGCPKGQPAREIQPQPIQVSWQVFTSHEPRTTSHDFFHKPRVTRGDVVNLSLSLRSSI